MPRPLKELAIRVCKAADEVQQTLGRSPTMTELAAHLQVTEEEVLEALEAAMSRQGASLDRPVGDDHDCCLGDLLPAPGPREEPEDLLALPELIAALPDPERTVIRLRFFQDLDQDAIAARIGFSQMHVSRLLRRSIARLRSQLLDA